MAPHFYATLTYFLKSSANFTDLSLVTVMTTADTKHLQYFEISQCPEMNSLYISFSTQFCKCYSISLAFRFVGGYPGFKCILNSLYFINRFVLNNSKPANQNDLFSEYSVSIAAFSMFCIVQLKPRRPSMPSNGCISSRSVISTFSVFVIALYSAPTLTFPTNYTLFFSTS